MSAVNKDIKADGSLDYTTVINFEAAVTLNANVGDPWRGRIMDNTAYAGATFNIGNSNNAPHELYAGPGLAANDFGDTGAAGINGGATASLTISSPGWTFTGIYLENTSALCVTTSVTTTFVNCFLRRQSASAGTHTVNCTGNATYTWNGCCIAGSSGGGNPILCTGGVAGGTSNITNCTMVSQSISYYPFQTNGNHTVNGVNNIMLNTAGNTQTGFNGTSTYNNSYNVIQTGGGNGGTGAYTKTTALLTSVTAGSENYRLAAGNFGTIVGGNQLAATLDPNGVTRVSGAIDAGAYVLLPTAPTVDATPAPAASYTVGDAFSVDHAATGTGTITFDISAGAVPSGTTITGATGVVAGTLTTAEAVSYTVRATDAWSQTGTRQFTTTINAPAVVSSGKNGLQLGLQLGLSIILCLALLLTGCASPVLYDEPGHVAIEYRGHDSQGVELFFTSPTKDSYLIQEVSWDWREGKGIESFRAPLPLWQRDRHSSRGADETRTMTIYPGTVEGQAETISGFAMLESDWPAGFNMGYRQWYPIKGRVVSAVREHGTTYSVTWRKDAISLAVAGKTFTWGR